MSLFHLIVIWPLIFRFLIVKPAIVGGVVPVPDKAKLVVCGELSTTARLPEYAIALTGAKVTTSVHDACGPRVIPLKQVLVADENPVPVTVKVLTTTGTCPRLDTVKVAFEVVPVLTFPHA
jgi:hypothetical protein